MMEIRNPVRWVDIRRDMTPIEQYFACRLSRGLPCQLGGTVPKEPTSGNTIRAEVIRFFAYGGSNEHPVLGPAIHLEGAWICGEEFPLDLTHADIRYVLRFFHCHFVDRVGMADLKCPALYMSGSRLAKGLQAGGMRTDGPVHLRKGFVADEKVDLSRAHIGGDLSCVGGKFNNGQDKEALMVNLTTVKGAMLLNNGFSAEGEVRLMGARIAGDFDCKGGRFNNLRGNALSADGMAVGGNVFLNNGFSAEGQVKLPQAQIGGDLDCGGGKFHNPKEYALSAFGATVGGNMFLCADFSAEGGVSISGASIGGELNCVAGRFHKPKDCALNASRMTTSGDVFFCKGFVAEGRVDISGANIGGNLDCAGGRFDNLGNYALNAERVVTRGHVFLNKYELRDGDRPFFACGRVRFANADIGRNFNCKGGQFFHWGDGSAIAAAGLRTRGAVFLSEGFAVQGDVDLNIAQIGGTFVCKKSSPATSIIDLSSTKAVAVDDDSDSWGPFKFLLDNFTYSTFYGVYPKDKHRLKWLKKRPEARRLKDGGEEKIPFSPLPYEQAAKVLFNMGHDNDARKILLEKERKITKYGKWKWWQNSLRWCWDKLAGYGYKPVRTFRFGMIVIIFGGCVFWYAEENKRIVPHQPVVLAKDKYRVARKADTHPAESAQLVVSDYPGFNPFLFSVDIFVPFFNLHQEPYWAPDSGNGNFFSWVGHWVGQWIRGDVHSQDVRFDWWWFLTLWYWLEIIAGWILTSLFLLSVTGLLRPRQSSGGKD